MENKETNPSRVVKKVVEGNQYSGGEKKTGTQAGKKKE